MSSNAKNALGTTITWNGNAIGEVTKIGGVEITADAQEVTNLASTAKEFISGIPDGGEVTIEGFFYSADTDGQIAIKNAIGGASGTLVITFPTAINAEWTMTAVVTKFATGDVDIEGGLPFSASFKPSGLPVLTISQSAGLTTPFSTFSTGTIIPAMAQATTSYVLEVITGTTSITITPTASAGVITITANGVSQVVTSGVASTAITLGSAGSVTPVTISVQETGKIPKVYTIQVARA